MSTQYCGCDPTCKPEPHYCERHTIERKAFWYNPVADPIGSNEPQPDPPSVIYYTPTPTGRWSGYVGPSLLLSLMYLFAVSCIAYSVFHSWGWL